MKTKLSLAAILALTLLAPLSVAQNETKIDVDVRETDRDGGDPQESTVFLGLDAVTLVIVLVVGVILIALVAALAGRDRYW